MRLQSIYKPFNNDFILYLYSLVRGSPFGHLIRIYTITGWFPYNITTNSIVVSKKKFFLRFCTTLWSSLTYDLLNNLESTLTHITYRTSWYHTSPKKCFISRLIGIEPTKEVKTWKVYRWTETTKGWSEKLIWACSSGEPK